MENKTKTQKILEYIRDNEPCRAKDICEAVLEKRTLPKESYNIETKKYIKTGEYSYYVGWSGFRISLAQNWGWHSDKSKALIKLTKKGYILTKLGEKRVK